jgi:parvulin-like peptidyl-prolyl isomerase
MKKITALISLFLIFLIASCELSENTAAKVGSIEISKEEYVAALEQRFKGNAPEAGYDSTAKYKTLNTLIEKKMRLNDAYDLSLDEDPQIVMDIQTQRERYMMNKYYEAVVVDKLISEEEVKAFYEKQKEEVKASHILIGWKGGNRSRATRTKEEALKLADELAAQAKAGGDFAKLAMQHSEDPSKDRNSGDLGYFTWGRMVPEFQEAAYALNIDQISDVVETVYGYHVIKVTDKRPNKNFQEGNFEEQERNIKVQLFRPLQQKGQKMWGDNINTLTEKYDAKVLEDNIKTLVDSVEARGLRGKKDAQALNETDKRLALAVWGGNDITLEQIINRYGAQVARLYPKLKKTSALSGEIKGFMESKMAIQEALSLGLDRDEKESKTLKDIKENRMLSLLEKRQITEKVNLDEETIKKYFEDHRDDFTTPEQIEIWEVFVKSEALAKKILEKAAAGNDFEKLVAKYSEDKVYKDKKGYIGYKEINRRGAVSKEAFKLGANKIGGPVKYRNGWVVLKTGNKKEKELKLFEQAESQVKSKLRRELTQTRRKEWKEELHDKYSVKINEKLIDSL